MALSGASRYGQLGPKLWLLLTRLTPSDRENIARNVSAHDRHRAQLAPRRFA
jgi:hypothetical protein